jgi:hypothetical protein
VTGPLSRTKRGSGSVERSGDWPIENHDDDRLGRSDFAKGLANEILGAPSKGGFVIGLTGSWGIGKTSILNMAVETIGDRAHVVQFNPWFFSGTDALITSFFNETAAQLGLGTKKLKKVAGKLAEYGTLVAPAAAIVGAAGLVQAASGVVSAATAPRSVHQRHEEIRKILATLNKPLVVMIDDLDRLQPDEVKDMVRLVRLVGDFPNTVYVLAFDRGRVEEVLGDKDRERGRAYLEKIVQVAYEVPMAREPDVLTMVLTALDQLIEGRSLGPLNQSDWTNVFTFIIKPLLNTPRQARRYLESLRLAFATIGDEVALVDVLGLEAVRVMRPDLFAALVDCADELGFQPTSTSPAYQSANIAPETTPLDECLKIDRELTQQISKYLFPMTQRYLGNVHYGADFATRWKRERRVADSSVFRFYLERRLPDGVLRASVVDHFIDTMSSENMARIQTEVLSGDELFDLISRVSDAASDIKFDVDAQPEDDPAAVGLPVLLDCYRRLPNHGRGFFDFGPAVLLGRLTYRLLNRITEVGFRAQVAAEAFRHCQTLSGAHIAVAIAGRRPRQGSDFLDVDAARALEDELRTSIVAADLETLMAEPDLLQLAELLTETAKGKVALSAATDDDRFALSLLHVASHDIRSFELGGAAMTSKKALMWPELVTLFGDEARLEQRVEDLVNLIVDGWDVSADDAEVIELAGRYASGWRPDQFLQQLVGAAESLPEDLQGIAQDVISPEDGSA